MVEYVTGPNTKDFVCLLNTSTSSEITTIIIYEGHFLSMNWSRISSTYAVMWCPIKVWLTLAVPHNGTPLSLLFLSFALLGLSPCW